MVVVLLIEESTRSQKARNVWAANESSEVQPKIAKTALFHSAAKCFVQNISIAIIQERHHSNMRKSTMDACVGRIALINAKT
jgi:hypothetical protein